MALKRLKQRGFTLIEMIISIVILGIISSMVAVFMAKPISGYIDSVRRAGLSDVADLALKRIGLDLRMSVPNSVRLSTGLSTCTASVSTSCFLEFIPVSSGGRYCTDADTGCTNTMVFGSSTIFDVLGPAHSAGTGASAAGKFLVIYNTGQSGLNAYEGGGSNLRTITNSTTATAIAFNTAFTYASPSNRFQVVPATGPVTFACELVGGTTTGTGKVNRYTNYNGASTAANFQTTQPVSGLGTARLLADNVSACSITYNTVSARNGMVSISLTITREGEPVTLMHQIHVDNMP